MVRLTRTVRFSVPVGAGGGLGAYYEMHVDCVGEADPTTGYLVDIRVIDEAVRRHAVPMIARCVSGADRREAVALLPEVVAALRGALGTVAKVRWSLTPALSIEMESSDMTTAVVRQAFEIACSHRLHADAMSEAANRALFGKCNSENGHGHNYRVEPAVEMRTGESARVLPEVEKAVQEVIVSRFDHKHLNLDTEEFAQGTGLMPSVENIAKVFFELLGPEVERRTGGAARVRSMTVWETGKTSARYPG